MSCAKMDNPIKRVAFDVYIEEFAMDTSDFQQWVTVHTLCKEEHGGVSDIIDINHKYNGYVKGTLVPEGNNDISYLVLCDDSFTRIVSEKEIIWI